MDSLAGHELCTRDSYVHKIDGGGLEQAHPNPAGQRAIARAVKEALFGGSGPGGPDPLRPVVAGCSLEPLYKPEKLILSCRSANFYLTGLRWLHWGAASAQSDLAIMHVNNCQPNCAGGTFNRYRVRVRLHDPGYCANTKRRQFHVIRVTRVDSGSSTKFPRPCRGPFKPAA